MGGHPDQLRPVSPLPPSLVPTALLLHPLSPKPTVWDFSDPPSPAGSPGGPKGSRGSPGASQEPVARPALLQRRVSMTPYRLLFPLGHLDPAERVGDARPKLWCALQAGRVMVFDASSWSLHQHCVRVGSSTLVRLLAGREGDGQAAGQDPLRPLLCHRGLSFLLQVFKLNVKLVPALLQCSHLNELITA